MNCRSAGLQACPLTTVVVQAFRPAVSVGRCREILSGKRSRPETDRRGGLPILNVLEVGAGDKTVCADDLLLR